MLSHVESLNARLASLELKLSQEQLETNSRLTSLRDKGIVERREGGNTRLTGLQLERQGTERLGERVFVRDSGYDFEEDTMEQFVGKTMGERLAWLVKKMWVESKLLDYDNTDKGTNWVIECYTNLMRHRYFTFGDLKSGVEIALAKMKSKDEEGLINLIKREVWHVVKQLENRAEDISSHSRRP